MQWNNYVFPTPRGLMLANNVIAKRASNGQFEIDGREEEIRALLVAAYGKVVTPRMMRHVKRACVLLKSVSHEVLTYAGTPLPLRPAHLQAEANVSKLTEALMHLALTGLNGVENEQVSSDRMMKIQHGLAKGMTTNALLKDMFDDLDEMELDDDLEGDEEDDLDDDSGDEEEAGGIGDDDFE